MKLRSRKYAKLRVLVFIVRDSELDDRAIFSLWRFTF